MNKAEYITSKVAENKEIAKGIFRLAIEGEFSANPGQFYMVRAWEKEPVLSRPLSLHKLEKDKIYFLYQVCGEGTEILKSLKPGDDINLTGPLGNGFDTKGMKGRIAIVAGGIGIAPFNYVAEKLKDNIHIEAVDLYAGFRNEVYAVEEMTETLDRVHISTENGSFGQKGYVTENLNLKGYDMVLCCGPEIMMNKVIEICKAQKVKVLVSTEKRMACGVGACLVCTCKTKQGNKRSCKDGPVFPGEDLVI